MSATGSVAPMFSYAQAAKGLAPSSQHNSNTASSNSSEYGNKDVSTMASAATAQIKTKPLKDHVENQSDNKQLTNGLLSTESQEARGQSQPDGGDIESKLDSPSANPSTTQNVTIAAEVKHSSVSSNQNGSIEAETKSLDDETEKSSHTEDHDRGKDIDDDWEKVSVPSVAAEKELKVAPPPAVNIWQQRKEAQDAKMREQAVQRPTTATSVVKPKVQAPTAREEGKRRQTAKEAGADKDTTSQRRPNSGARANLSDRKEQSPSQLSPRSQSKSGEKNGAAPPAPTDTESWPTPESAIGDERRRSNANEKAEKIDAKAASQKKWIQMPFVPTAKFETQLPPAAAARRGGRAANRGRDAANRGSHATLNASATDKAENGSMGPPPTPKQNNEQDRGRKGESAKNQRASSVPTHSHRSGSVDQAAAVSSKPSIQPQQDQVVPQAQANLQTVPDTTATEISAVVEDFQPLMQQSDIAATSGQGLEGDASYMASSQSPTGGETRSRGSVQIDRSKGNVRDEYRGSTEFGDRGVPAGREWSRGRPDATREKSDSWREKREPRPERGRGGYRGRGGHANYNSHAQTYTAPLPQNGFETKSYSNDSRSRQASQPFSQAANTTSGRNTHRSQSIPITAMPSGFYQPTQGYPQALSPVQGDLGFGNFTGQMPPGIINAMPYADQLNSMALISMVVTQLEYYFSINNLCKDLFLRKNMDSQGFVPLHVVAGFKRMQALTDGQMSHEQFRNVCQQAPSIELVTSEDGEDKIRARQIWSDFVLPLEERLPSAQTDGPIVRSHQRHQSSQMFQGLQNYPGGSGHVRNPAVAMNGYSEPFTPAHNTSYSPPAPFDGSLPDAFSPRPGSMTNDSGRRSSAASPFGHVQSPPLQEPGRKSSFVTNGHHRSMSNVVLPENTFPDEKISELKVVVRDPAVDASQSGSNNHSESNTFNLRGGAGSPQQEGNLKNIRFGQASPNDEEDQTPFWTKHGRIARVPEGPNYIHEDYLSLRDKALAQSENKHFDGALSVLYPFWSTFLVENFNVSMYQEFARFAAEEASTGSENGQQHLLSFYDALLKRRIPISERIATDLTTLYRTERTHSGKGPIFETLRKTLRNGATDFKTVKRITICLTAEEKSELGV